MINKKIAHILAEIIGDDEDNITPETKFTQEYGIEPIDVAQLIIDIENKFNISINDDEAACFENVGDITLYVNNLLNY